MHAHVYEKLRDFYHVHPIGFPKTESGVEMRILKRLFSKKEAETALALTPQKQSSGEIATKTGKDAKTITTILERMRRKGLILKHDDGYRLIPFIPGIYENQLKSMDKAMARDFEELYPYLSREVFSSPTAVARVVPVETCLPLEVEVSPFERASEIVRNAGRIALGQCLCRKEQKLVGKCCLHPNDDICLIFSPIAEHFIDMNLANEVTVEEALKAIKRGEEAGLVRSTLNVQRRPTFMCQCCTCCCVFLRAIRELDIPSAVMKSNFCSCVDSELCTGCAACIDICPMDALSWEDSKIAVNARRCLGCGLCVLECPAAAILLKPKTQRVIPPASFSELVGTIAEQKKLIRF